MKTIVANFILEGVYFYSGFMFFYNLGRNHKMTGSSQEIRYINRDENTHLWLFRNIILELEKEEPQLFTREYVDIYRSMVREGCEREMAWGGYAIGNEVPGLTAEMITDYIKYLGNLRCASLGWEPVYEGHDKEPETMAWVSQYSNANLIKTDFFEARSTAYAKSSALVDDL
jgi:ribonucleoside-diphosphate reductase beta chain